MQFVRKKMLIYFDARNAWVLTLITAAGISSAYKNFLEIRSFGFPKRKVIGQLPIKEEEKKNGGP